MNTALASLLVLVSPAPAAAPVALAYDAPEGCATQEQFVAAVAARGAVFEGANRTDRTMVVAIRQQDGGFAGAFQVRDGRSATDKREVHGASCGEVVDALEVVTAIALHPAEPTLSPPAVAKAPPSKVSEAAASEPRLRASTRFFPPRSESVEVGAGTLRFDLQRSVTVYAGGTMGLIPSVFMPRYDLSVDMAHFITTPAGAQRIAGPVVQTRLSGLGPATYRTTDTTTNMGGLSFGFGLCQSPIYDTRGWVVLFCGEFGGGLMYLRTKAADGKEIQSKNVGFGALNLGAELRYNFASVFQVGAKLGGGLTYGELTAERADGSRIFGSSTAVSWAAYALLGAGVHF